VLPDPLDAVLFDAGGTLVRLDFAFIARTARSRGADVGENALRRGEAASRRAIDAYARAAGSVKGTDATRRGSYFGNLLHAAGIDRETAQVIVADLEAATREANLWRVPFEGAAETLRGLRASGLRTAVVSNADGRIESLLGAAGLAPHLDLIVDSHYEGVEKPDPEIFRRALDRLGLKAARCAYVGDIYSIDVVGARAAGLVPVIIDPLGAYEDLDCARIERLEELLDEIEPRA
jgi:putative hydrolase of the HAD superfamily